MGESDYHYYTSKTGNYSLLVANAKANRKNPTETEDILWKFIRGHQLGERFRRQHPIGDYIVDFVCLKKWLVIEVDGGYHNKRLTAEEDAKRTKALNKMGFEVIRFTNDEVVAQPELVVEQIRNKIQMSHTTEDTCSPSPLLRRGRGRLLIFSAPSGSGKSTIVQFLMQQHPELNLAFSISATSRPPRGTEQNGVEYFFLSPEEFRQRIENNEFLEYEEVYADRFYGTLKEQVERQLEAGQNVVFDVDVKGGCNIKRFYGERAMSLFIQPPSVEELRRRLIGRATDSMDQIENRLAKASYELTFAPQFDHVIVNDVLEDAEAETLNLVQKFLSE